MRLTKSHRKNLRRQLRIERELRFADRIRIILLLDQGWSYAKIAEAFFVDQKTIGNYKNRYLEYGIEGLINDSYKGRPSLLTDEEKKVIEDDLQKNLFKSALEIIDHIKKKFGVTYSISGMRYLLFRLGFSFKKTKGVPAKSDIEKQKKFIKFYKRLIKRLKKNNNRAAVYFADATHPTHGTSLQYGWIKKGEEFWIKTPNGRYRMNIHGAICVEGLKVVAKTYEKINRFSICDFFKLLREKHPDMNEKIYFICDNASYYIAKDTQEKAKEVGINMIFLPTYSPNLNIIEMLWKFMKKKVFSEYHETPEEFRTATRKFFQYIRKYKNELETLLTENFQLLDSSLAT